MRVRRLLRQIHDYVLGIETVPECSKHERDKYQTADGEWVCPLCELQSLWVMPASSTHLMPPSSIESN